MRFDASQHMRMSQQMKLAPRMIQSMEILQMPILQLEERIAQELESNVTLEAADGDEDALGADGPGRELEGAARVEAIEERRQDALDEQSRPLTIDESSGAEDFSRLDDFERDNPDLAGNEFDAESVPTSHAAADGLDFRRDAGLGSEFSRPGGGDADAKAEALSNTASRGASLQDQLREQWHLSDVEEGLRPLGDAIIGYIEDDGYLRTDLATIIDRLPGGPEDKPAPERLERALHALQLLLEPAGVGARDTRECLLLQIDALVDEHARTPEERSLWDLVRRLVSDHLEDLAQNRLPRIAEKTGEPMARIAQAMERMRHLNLAPGRQLVDEAPGIIVPDAIVEHDPDQDRYIVYLNDRRLPNLRINREYAMLAKEKSAPKQTKEFIRKNLGNAQWLIEAVEQRKRTLERVIRVVVDAQREYFDYGPQFLKPLPMTLVADQLGVHVATVSRAVADKYVQTPRGVVPLRGFFSGGTQTSSGEDVSWDAIRAAMKEVIDAEDPKSPLSDDAIAEALKQRGIEIARRTVAKYREQLNIPAARLRKKF
jgi:RNA polymerase sigma-54 factor